MICNLLIIYLSAWFINFFLHYHASYEYFINMWIKFQIKGTKINIKVATAEKTCCLIRIETNIKAKLGVSTNLLLIPINRIS